MKARPKSHASQGNFLLPTLAEQCDPRHPLRKLAERLPWVSLEKAFADHYSAEGRPAKPVRLMVGLLLLKQMFNQSDESVVERWKENPYWQQFCGMEHFQWDLPCDPSDLVYFRQRIGETGMEQLLGISVWMHGERGQEREIIIDSTVAEKNITWPSDVKAYRKIIERSWKLADQHKVRLRRRYRKEVRKHLQAQRWNKNPRRRKKARAARRRLCTIAGALVRELERKLPEQERARQQENFALYRRVLRQKTRDKEKIYSLHEPHVYCMSKGKEHKKYEFGVKASVAIGKEHGVIVAAVAHARNEYDGHTLYEVLEHAEVLTGKRAEAAVCDRGYRGRTKVGGTEIHVPEAGAGGRSEGEKRKARKRFRRRASIEPVIGHLKSDYRLARCYLKGFAGDQMNLLLAATAWNLRKWMREAVSFWLRMLHFWQGMLQALLAPLPMPAIGHAGI